MMTMIFRKQTIYFLALLLLLSFSAWTRNARAQEDTPPWKFVVISDTQGGNRVEGNKSCINDKVVRALAEDIMKEHPDFVLVSGDLVNGWFGNGGASHASQYADWKAAMATLYKNGIPLYPVRGNHDAGPERLALPPLPSHLEPSPAALVEGKQAFKSAFTELYKLTNGPAGEEGLTYSFTHKNAFIVGLDEFVNQHKVNQPWLDKQFAGNDKPHVFVYGHEPAFQTKHRDNLGFYPKERDAFWDSIGKAGGRVYFCGHDHMYNRALIPDNAGNPIRQIIAGTGGGRLYTWSGEYKDKSRITAEYTNSDYHGYVLVTVDGPRVTVSWKALVKAGAADAWQVLDAFSYVVPQAKGKRVQTQRGPAVNGLSSVP